MPACPREHCANAMPLGLLLQTTGHPKHGQCLEWHVHASRRSWKCCTPPPLPVQRTAPHARTRSRSARARRFWLLPQQGHAAAPVLRLQSCSGSGHNRSGGGCRRQGVVLEWANLQHAGGRGKGLRPRAACGVEMTVCNVGWHHGARHQEAATQGHQHVRHSAQRTNCVPNGQARREHGRACARVRQAGQRHTHTMRSPPSGAASTCRWPGRQCSPWAGGPTGASRSCCCGCRPSQRPAPRAHPPARTRAPPPRRPASQQLSGKRGAGEGRRRWIRVAKDEAQASSSAAGGKGGGQGRGWPAGRAAGAVRCSVA